MDLNFQTPTWVANYMVSLAVGLNPRTILEPTPGIGNIVKAVSTQFPSTKIIVPEDDFFAMSENRYDLIIANPPFSPMSVGYKFMYKFMELSDNIIILMPWLTLINSTKRAKDLTAFGLKSVTWLPRNVFKNARVQCCILQLDKSFKEITLLNFLWKEECYEERIIET